MVLLYPFRLRLYTGEHKRLHHEPVPFQGPGDVVEGSHLVPMEGDGVAGTVCGVHPHLVAVCPVQFVTKLSELLGDRGDVQVCHGSSIPLSTVTLHRVCC